MADMPSNVPGAPQGAEPMKKSTGKVQPKKETVRINLPPKPSAAPTIKLPTLPPGGPTGVPAMAPSASAAAPAAPKPALAAPKAPTAMPQQRPMAPAVPVVKPMSAVDRGLSIAAAIAALIAVGTTAYMAFMF
jgi:hypothetical protein